LPQPYDPTAQQSGQEQVLAPEDLQMLVASEWLAAMDTCLVIPAAMQPSVFMVPVVLLMFMHLGSRCTYCTCSGSCSLSMRPLMHLG
jgi:hypothetical protein